MIMHWVNCELVNLKYTERIHRLGQKAVKYLKNYKIRKNIHNKKIFARLLFIGHGIFFNSGKLNKTLASRWC